MLYNLKLHYSCSIQKLIWLTNKNINSLFSLPAIDKLRLFFRINKLENLEHPKLFNYFYLFRFFFSEKAKITGYKTYFVLGKHYSNLEIGYSVNKKRIYFPIYLFSYEIQPIVNLTIARDFVYNVNQFSLVLWDTNIFTEKKTNVGLFDLIDPIQYRISYKWGKQEEISLQKVKYLLSSFKFILK